MAAETGLPKEFLSANQSESKNTRVAGNIYNRKNIKNDHVWSGLSSKKGVFSFSWEVLLLPLCFFCAFSDGGGSPHRLHSATRCVWCEWRVRCDDTVCARAAMERDRTGCPLISSTIFCRFTAKATEEALLRLTLCAAAVGSDLSEVCSTTTTDGLS